MVSLQIEKGKFLFEDVNNNKHFLLDALDVSSNHSRVSFHSLTAKGIGNFTLIKDIFKWLTDINDGTVFSTVRNVVLLSVISELIQKPRNYCFLHIGKWSLFTKYLAEMLKKFNDKNRLYCLTDDKVSQADMKNVSFILPEEGEFLLPESKFSAIFIDEVDVIHLRKLDDIPKNVILSLKDSGKLFFFTFPDFFSKSPIKDYKEFKLSENFSFVSLSIKSEIKNKFYEQTSQGKIHQEKRKITKIVNELSKVINNLEFLPVTEQILFLDRMIAEVHKVEKIINKIYAELNSMYIKPYCNELKESLIDYRLQIEGKFHKSYFEKVLEVYRLVLYEMKAKDDFVFD